MLEESHFNVPSNRQCENEGPKSLLSFSSDALTKIFSFGDERHRWVCDQWKSLLALVDAQKRSRVTRRVFFLKKKTKID